MYFMNNGYPDYLSVNQQYLSRSSSRFEKAKSHSNTVKQPLHKTLSSKISNEQVFERAKTFAKESTIHGVWHIIRNDRHWISRLCWAIAFCICFGVCLVFITASIVRFLSYEVKTTTSVEAAYEIEFPAITICNENYGKKSIIGTNEVFLKSLTAMIAGSEEEFMEKYQEALSTCQSAETKNVSSKILEEMNLGYDFFRHVGFTKSFSILSTDSYYSAVKCWWKNSLLNCSNSFLNHMTDHGWCFTINAHPDVVKSYSLGFDILDSAYGINEDHKLFTLSSTGPQNNLRLLLDVHQDDYCITRSDTAGFKILIHNSRVQPLFFLDRPISLAPGYETRIGVRFRRQIKKTESLGRCVDFKHLSLYPNATVYFKEACYLECFTKSVYQHCQCVPAYGPPNSYYLLAKQLGIKYVKACFNDTIMCMKQYERIFLNTNLHDQCVECVDPCNETEYDFQISYSYFPSLQSFKMYTNLSRASTITEMRDNYVMANFYVETMLINIITETQAFTVDQLVADMGGQLGFLLGMSVLSLFEFIQFIMPAKRKLSNGKRENKINNPIDYQYKKKF